MIKKLTPAGGGHEGVKGAAQMMMMMSSSSSWLTGPELEAAYQLIQLSGDGHSSSSSKDGSSTISSGTFDDDLVIMMVAPSDLAVESYGADMTAKCSAEAIHDQDVASTSSSSSSPSSSSSSSSSCSAIKTGENFAVWEEIDASCSFVMERKRKRKRKFRSIADLYANTKPNLVKKAAS